MNEEDLEFDPEARKEAVAAAINKMTYYTNSIINNSIVVAINMREPSHRKRMYVWDINKGVAISNHHCAHGSGSSDPSNPDLAIRFSNKPNSHMSSLGAMITGHTYYGKHGKSLRLYGLEQGVNDNVAGRDIIVHAAEYVTDDYILQMGRAGQSWGCPAVDPAISNNLIDTIKDGVFFYIYY